MAESDWASVDDYIVEKLLGEDEKLSAALKANTAARLPEIDVSAAQGKLLHLLARMSGARRILEIGTLGGYSTIWLARALPEDGELVTLELDPGYAEVARANLERAGLGKRVDIRVGRAADTLAAMTDEAPFDLAFIDADKQSNAAYVREAIRLARPGATIIVDNVIRDGRVLDAASDDPAIIGTRALFDQLAADRRIDATAIQTVGAKGWDGFVLAMVQ